MLHSSKSSLGCPCVCRLTIDMVHENYFMGSNCTVSASTGFALGSRHLCQTSSPEDWSMKEVTGLNDGKVKEVLEQLERLLSEEAKNMYRLGTLKG